MPPRQHDETHRRSASLWIRGQTGRRQATDVSGQFALQIVVISKPPPSWTAGQLGQSDDPASPHFADQAIELVGKRKPKGRYFRDRAALVKTLESTTGLLYDG